jgi:prepilin-type N-terminal cleavage/methylation domain-containing protein
MIADPQGRSDLVLDAYAPSVVDGSRPIAKPSSQPRRAFTLIELLVVVALIAGMSAFLIGGFRENKTASLQSAQATLANMLMGARTRAMATGCRVRLLIQADTSNPARFRRMLAVQQESVYKSDAWTITISVAKLPEGIAVLPYKNNIPAGLYENPADWVKTSTTGSSGNELHSSALYATQVPVVIESATSENWDVIQFTPNDTMSTGVGDIVLATVRSRQPGSYSSGQSPVRADSPNSVRGVSLSTYGVPALINSRGGF